MATYWLLHDYGPEGWSVVAECNSKLALAEARELHLASQGGRVVAVEILDPLVLYGSAGYERQSRAAREAAERDTAGA